MTFRPNDVGLLDALRASAAVLWKRPRLLPLACRVYSTGHAESLVGAIVLVGNDSFRAFHSDPAALALGEIHRDEGTSSPFTNAPVFRRYEDHERAREAKREAHEARRAARRQARQAEVQQQSVARRIRSAPTPAPARSGRRVKVAVRRQRTARRSFAMSHGPPGDDQPPPEPAHIRLMPRCLAA